MNTKCIFLFLLSISLSLALSAQEIQRTFKWTYDGHSFTQTFTFNKSDYEYYLRLKKNGHIPDYIKDHNVQPEMAYSAVQKLAKAAFQSPSVSA